MRRALTLLWLLLAGSVWAGTPARWIGITQTNTGTQNSDAWDAFMLALDVATAPTVDFDSGTYNFARTIDVIRPVVMQGAAGGPWVVPTRLLFPAGVDGIELHSYASYNGTPGFNRADGAIVRNFRVTANGQSTVRHGVIIHTASQIENLQIENFRGNGVHMLTGLDGSPPASGSLTSAKRIQVGNVGSTIAITSISRTSNVTTVTTASPHQLDPDTVWFLNNTNEEYCIESVTRDGFRLGAWGALITSLGANSFSYPDPGADASSTDGWELRTGNGLYVHGGDANACHFELFSVTGADAWGIYEDSQLGNLHISHHTDENGLGGFWAAQPNGTNVFLRCYSEANNPLDYINAPSWVVGGTMGATQVGNAGRLAPQRLENAKATARNSDYTLQASLGLGSAPSSIPHLLGVEIEGSINTQHLFYNFATDLLGGWSGNWLSWSYNYSGNPTYLIAHDSAVAPNGRSVDGGYMAFPKGFISGTGQLIDHGTAAPTTGARKRGDIRWNVAFAVGQPLGWFCTADGTPGTWVAGPNL